MENSSASSLSILTTCSTWHGANDYSFLRAFRRAGHCVTNVPAQDYFPIAWSGLRLKMLRKLLKPSLVKLYNERLQSIAQSMKPDLLFIFKGELLTAETIETIRDGGAIAIQFYPDTGFSDFGPYLEKAIEKYDWVFSTKPSGPKDLIENYRQPNVSFVPHAFDPETHFSPDLSEVNFDVYKADICFIGNTSSSKSAYMLDVHKAFPSKNIKIWGSDRWKHKSLKSLHNCFQGRPVTGMEYSKAISASKINLGLLFEGGASALEADKITARTFEIPAAGGFMLHQRTNEVLQYYHEGKEVACFDGKEEMIEKIKFYLENDEARRTIAKAGYNRTMNSGYSVDDRVNLILAKYHELKSQRRPLIIKSCRSLSRID